MSPQALSLGGRALAHVKTLHPLFPVALLLTGPVIGSTDVVGWRGPAEIISVNTDDGNFSVRIEGRTLIRRPQEVRLYVPCILRLCDKDIEVVGQRCCGTKTSF